MKPTLRNPFPLALAPLATLLVAAGLTGCSGDGDDDGGNFVPKRVTHASASSSPVVVEGKYMVYLASEALSGIGGTNFNLANGDGDTGDDCAVVLDMPAKNAVELNVATIGVKIVADQIYLVVSETADSKDWNADADSLDFVLLHWSKTLPLSFVDEIHPGNNAWGVADDRLYYVRGNAGLMANGDTNMSYLESSAPTTPVTVLHSDALTTLSVEILAIQDDLIFLTSDEVAEARDLNGDLDTTDGFVLSLLDGTNPAGAVQNVGLSVASLSSPVGARSTGTGDWLVGFLVDEATQSNFPTGLNDPTVGAFGFGLAWMPSNCGSYVDADTLDQVLHALSYATWSAAPLANPPENTGVPGTGRVLATSTAVATLVLEVDDGGCDLNADGDTADEILRWALFATPQLPFGLATELNAVADSVPGNTNGVSDLSNKLFCVISESEDDTDHDGDTLLTHNLVAWVDPTVGSPAWVVDHSSSGGIQPGGASWLADRPERDRLLVAFQESVIDIAINTGDADKLDSVPTFARFDPSNASDFDFPGPAIAVAAATPGIVIAGAYGMYRVDEAADNRDWSGDGIKDDFVIWRTNISSNFSAFIALANNLAGPVAATGGSVGAAFLADEAMAGADLNNDGRMDGFIVTWFRIS